MLIMDIPRKCPEGFSFVEIPLYHRAHLALAPRTPLQLCLMPVQSLQPELVVSPFAFEVWDKLWRLTASLRDRPGLVYDAADTLRRLGITILTAESCTIEEQSQHQLEMVIQARADQIQELEWCLLARLFEQTAFHPDGLPRLRIRRVHSLWHAKRMCELPAEPGAFAPVLETGHVDETDPRVTGKSRMLRLRLPASIKSVLREKVSERRDGRVDFGYHLRLSDTKDRFLRVVFFRGSDSVIHARVEHADQVGALAALTRVLRDSGFNILTFLRSPCETRGRSRLELVVRANTLLGAQTLTIKREFERALAAAASEDLQITVGYPRGYSREWQRIQINQVESLDLIFDESSQQDNANDTAWLPRLTDKLNTHFRTLAKEVQNRSLSEEEKNRWVLANSLQMTHPDPSERLRHKSLFVSCHLAGTQLQLIEAKAAARGFAVVTGKNLQTFPSLTEGLLSKIGSCTHYLGVWSEIGASRSGDVHWPSPWLLWELGVAHAQELVWCLLISGSIAKDAWQRLQFAKQHYIYELDFETQLDAALEDLAARSANRTPFRARS